MKRTLFAIVLVALLTCAGLHAQTAGRVCVSQEVLPGGPENDFTFLGIVDVFNRSAVTAAAVYSYGVPNLASYNGNPPPPLSSVSQLFVVQTSDGGPGGGPSLFHVHDRFLDGSGGTANTAYMLAGDTAMILVRDDPGEPSIDIGGTQFSFHRAWIACCTDGGVIGTLEGGWTLDAAFTAAPTGISSWQATSASGAPIALVLQVGRRARLQACNDVGLVDLKPGSNPNCVNPGSMGVVSVAILSTAFFDAPAFVVEASIVFGGASPLRCSVEDVDLDGDLDLVCKFRVRDVMWPSPGSDCGFVQLTSDLTGGGMIVGGAVACLPGEPTCEAGTPTTP